MSDPTAAASAAPAAAATSPAPAATGAAAPAAAPAASNSLFKPDGVAAAAAAPAAHTAAPGDDLDWLPAKFRVMGADGALDLAASSKKLGEGYTQAEKRIGTAASAPDSPDGYQFTPPEAFKDVPLDEGLSKSFRERAHKAGLSQDQYAFVMGEYFNLVPTLLDAKASYTAESARTELSKVWKTTTELEAGMNAAERAVAQAPEEMRSQIKEKYGADPLFWQFAAHYGRQLQEDRPPAAAATSAPAEVNALMASEAYRNPKHADHARISQQVRQHFERRYGSAPTQ